MPEAEAVTSTGGSEVTVTPMLKLKLAEQIEVFETFQTYVVSYLNSVFTELSCCFVVLFWRFQFNEG